MKNFDKIIKMVEKDPVNKLFKKNEAVLHIKEGGEYAWIECGGMSYYFHKSGDNPVKHEQYENMKGDIVNKTVVPYDGYETGKIKS